MTGFVWITSYLILSATVIILAMLLVGLGKEVLTLKQQSAKGDGWPFLDIAPGDLLPDPIVNLLSKDRRSISGFVFLLVSPLSASQTLASLETLCGSINSQLSIVVCNSDVAQSFRLDHFIDRSDVDVLRANDADKIFQISSNVVVYAKNDRVIDATSQLFTPLSLRERFSFLI